LRFSCGDNNKNGGLKSNAAPLLWQWPFFLAAVLPERKRPTRVENILSLKGTEKINGKNVLLFTKCSLFFGKKFFPFTNPSLLLRKGKRDLVK
jgi:hypothetical protein